MLNTYDRLDVGQTFELERELTAEDVEEFARLSGDDNPIHIDSAAAVERGFAGPIVHGVLLLAIVSKVLGRDFPGPGSVAVSISCKFLRPVPVGSTIRVEVRVAEKLERRRHIRMRIAVYLGKKMAAGGEAVLVPPEDD